jgi:hypothetical protein
MGISVVDEERGDVERIVDSLKAALTEARNSKAG